MCRDGRYRRGKILITFNGRYRQAGTETSFDSYHVNDNHVTGLRTVENMGLNDMRTNIWYQIQVDGQLNLTDGTV